MKLRTVAKQLRLSQGAVYRLVRTGALTATREGRRWDIAEEDLGRFVEASRIVPGTLGAARPGSDR